MAKLPNCDRCGAPPNKWGTGACPLCGVGYDIKSEFPPVIWNNPPVRKIGKRGPKPGTVARFLKADLKLCPSIQKMTRKGMTITEACIKLAEGGHIDGAATQNSRVRRLMKSMRNGRFHRRLLAKLNQTKSLALTTFVWTMANHLERRRGG